MRIITALIAVAIALFYLKFFDSIFKLLLENTLSFELSLPVKIYSFTLTLHFPTENEEENKNGDGFFIMNKIEKERERKMNEEKNVATVAEKTRMENCLDIKDDKITNKNKEKKKIDNVTSTYAQFEKIYYFLLPMKSEKIFRNVPDAVKNNNHAIGITDEIKDMKLFQATKGEINQSINLKTI